MIETRPQQRSAVQSALNFLTGKGFHVSYLEQQWKVDEEPCTFGGLTENGLREFAEKHGWIAYPRFDKCGDGKYRVIDILEGYPVPTHGGDVLRLEQAGPGWAYRVHKLGFSARWRYREATKEDAAAKIRLLHSLEMDLGEGELS